MKTEIKTGGFGVVLRMRESCGLDAAQRAVIPRDYNSRCRVDAKGCPPGVAAPNGRVKGAYQLTEDSIARMPRWQRWALYAFAALTLTGILPYGRCRPSGLVVRSRGLVASHPALHRGWSRLVARDLVMKAEVYRDNAGFWMARIEEDEHAGKPGHRQGLPPPDATRRTIGEQGGSKAALRRVMSREARCPHGHR